MAWYLVKYRDSLTLHVQSKFGNTVPKIIKLATVTFVYVRATLPILLIIFRVQSFMYQKCLLLSIVHSVHGNLM